jgi:hypothetical protein
VSLRLAVDDAIRLHAELDPEDMLPGVLAYMSASRLLRTAVGHNRDAARATAIS